MTNIGSSGEWEWTYIGESRSNKCQHGWCLNQYCNLKKYSQLFVIDSNLEKKMKFGVKWSNTFGKIPNGTVYISKLLAVDLNVKIGDILVLPLTNIVGLFRQAGFITDTKYPSQPMRRINIPVIIGNIYDDVSSWGKFRKNENSGLVMEFDSFIDHISKFIHPSFNLQEFENFKKVNLYESATNFFFNIPNRLDVYSSPYYDDVQRSVTEIGSRSMINFFF